MPDPAMCRRCSARVPWLSFWGNLALGIYKLVIGVLGRSSALVADALHSFADVIGSAGIVVATKVSGRDPSRAYPYGFGKAEFIGAVFVYTLLFFFGAGIIINAVMSIANPRLEPPHLATALGAAVSVLYNYVMYSYATCVGKRNNSPAILADAFENRADAISSVACIGGIAGAMTIHPVCDPIAALFVGLIIVWNCQEQMREAARGLMDAGMDKDALERIRRRATAEEGVVAVSFLRTRQTGARYWIDIGIQVSTGLTVEEADAVATRVRDKLKAASNCHHVEVFVSAEDETESTAGSLAPAAV